MVKITGTLEVFQNKNGYVTAVFKAWSDRNEVLGKSYMDASLPENVKIKEGQSLTLDVKEGYLNAVHVKSKDNEFTKLKINVIDCDVIRVFPEEKKAKPSKKVAK